jgi:hypothetical protein
LPYGEIKLPLAQFNFTHKMKRNTQQLKDLTIQVRRDIRMVHNVNSGHPGSLGCTEFMGFIPKFNGPQRRF